MSFDELQNAALKMSPASRVALAECLLRSLRTSLEIKNPSSPPRSAALQALFATWDAEDETEDPRELEARRQDLRKFQRALNANRPSERPLYP
ncbi:MAG: hypothetical protein V3T72_01240 [Thermoanaerobaculia bacterium]